MTIFIPEDAYCATLQSDGTVVISELADPSAAVVIVAEFMYQTRYYKAFYHDNIDTWELFGSDDLYELAGSTSELYGLANDTALQFRDKLLAGPDGNRLVRQMVREISEEIDREIINDIAIASGQPLPQIVLNQPQIKPNRKLKVKWTAEAAQDLSIGFKNYDRLIGKSRLTEK